MLHSRSSNTSPPRSGHRWRAVSVDECGKVARRDPNDVQDANVRQSPISAQRINGRRRHPQVLSHLLHGEQPVGCLPPYRTPSIQPFSQTQARHKIAANRSFRRRRMGIALGAVPNVFDRLQLRATPADAGAHSSQAECRRFEPAIPLHRSTREPLGNREPAECRRIISVGLG